MINCDRCGEECKEGSNWGNCTNCGDDICEKCSSGFDDHGECGKCTSFHSSSGKRIEFEYSQEEWEKIQIWLNDHPDFEANRFIKKMFYLHATGESMELSIYKERLPDPLQTLMGLVYGAFDEIKDLDTPKVKILVSALRAYTDGFPG